MFVLSAHIVPRDEVMGPRRRVQYVSLQSIGSSTVSVYGPLVCVDDF